MRGTVTKRALVNRYMAYCTEERTLMMSLGNNQASPERMARQETRLKRLQEKLIPKLQGELQAEFKTKSQA